MADGVRQIGTAKATDDAGTTCGGLAPNHVSKGKEDRRGSIILSLRVVM